MSNKFKSHLIFPNIKLQINLIFLLSSIIPICIFGIFAISNARGEMLSQSRTLLETDALRVNSTLFDITTSVLTSVSNLTDTTETRSLFNHDYVPEDDTRFNFLDTSLRNYRTNTAAISSIHIYTNNPTLPNSNYISYLDSGFENQTWYHELDSSEYFTWFCSPELDRFNHTIYELTLVERIPLVNCSYSAFLVTKLDSNYIRNRLITNDHLIMSSIDDSNIFFASDRSYIWQPMPFPEEVDNQIFHYTGSTVLKEEEALTAIVTFLPYKTNNHFYIQVCDLRAYGNINHITKLYLMILLFATLVPAVIILLFSSYFSGRIQILKRAMHQASLGDYNIIEQFHGDDELADTFQDLKTTVDLIHEKEAKYYEAQISEQRLVNSQQQMEFKMLASQINPHFLYNTLETIRMQAVASSNRDVADSINLLGKTMHYVLENSGTDSTTLAKELNHVETYLRIQQLRFGDRVNYSIHVPPYLNLERFRILPLLLQPIVENAIVHGLEEVTENGSIEISLILEEPNLYITIHDNGEGMDAKTCNLLRENIHRKSPQSNSSIGLRNIDQRLRLLYGEEYGLTIDSELNEGATVTLCLPLDQIIDVIALNDMIAEREQYWEQDMD